MVFILVHKLREDISQLSLEVGKPIEFWHNVI